MKAKDLILITTHLEAKDLLGSSGHRVRSQLKQALALASQFALNPIVVLGKSGDELLINFSELENCDLTFDTNFSGSIFSSIQSGLAAAQGAAFILKLGETFESEEVWRTLDQAMWQTPPTDGIDVFTVLSCEGGDRISTYPQLVSVAAVPRLQKLPIELEWLHDPQLKIKVVSDHKPTVSLSI